MAYKKKGKPAAVRTAEERLQGVQQFDSAFDFGNELTANNYAMKIDAVNGHVKVYNGLLTSADGVGTQFEIDLAELRNLNSRLLNAVGSKHGYNSIEYEKAGGKRTSEIKRGPKKTKKNTPE